MFAIWSLRKAALGKPSDGKSSVELHQFWAYACEHAALD